MVFFHILRINMYRLNDKVSPYQIIPKIQQIIAKQGD